MFGTHFYHSTIRKTVVAFGTIFNNIQIRRVDGSGNVAQSLRVPLAYGPKGKFLARLFENPSFSNKVQTTVPRMGFDISSFSYDSTRKLNTLNKRRKIDSADNSKLDFQYLSVPYNIDFNLYIFAKQQDDALQCVEQILPYFTPAYTLTINAVPEMGIKQDFPVILNSLTYEDDYEGDFATRRSIVYTLTFTVKTNFYGPVDKQGVVKKVRIDQYTNVTDAPTDVDDIRYEVVPNPTTADADDDFGFTETITENPSSAT